MSRRLLPTLAALVLILAGLGWGLWSLQRIFATEREDARASLRSRREALEQYALATLRQWLKDQMDAGQPDAEAALADPLMPARGVYLRVRGEQRLPRLAQSAPGERTPGKERYLRLREGTEPPDDEEGGPWGERLALVRAVRTSLAKGDRRGAHEALAALLRHRARYLLSAVRDLPCFLVVLEDLEDKGDPVPQLMQGLVRQGFSDGQGARTMGLQRLLLTRRSGFTRADFDFLRERVSALSALVRAPTADFEARAAEFADAPLPLPESLPGPALVRAGWYLEPVGTDSVRGVAVDFQLLRDSLTREMREHGLLDADGVVRLPEGEVLPLASLRLSVETPRWTREASALESRFRLKTGLVAVCAFLAVGIAVLGFVTQRRKARFLELKSDFVATVSHELRTPLASIRLLAETLERRVSGVPEARDYPARIIHEADGLGFLVENLLSFNRIDKGRWVARPAPVKLEELVGLLRRDVEGWPQVPVELTSEAGEAELCADPQLLRLLFANLARNAIAYNTRSPVRLRVEALPGGRVRFSDNGVGIPESEWLRVFGEFYRLRGRGPEVPGSGLGLALCQRIVRLHGGTLRVAASSPEGTTFEMHFPEKRP